MEDRGGTGVGGRGRVVGTKWLTLFLFHIKLILVVFKIYCYTTSAWINKFIARPEDGGTTTAEEQTFHGVTNNDGYFNGVRFDEQVEKTL